MTTEQVCEWDESDEPRIYEPGIIHFDDWKIDDLIGEGANGRVYRLKKTLGSVQMISAMKVVRIEHNREMDRMLRSMGQSDAVISSRYRESLNSTIREIQQMIRLSDHPNIVRCDDYKIYRIGGIDVWDVQIRMEYLTPLQTYLEENGGKLAEKEVVRLGEDLCEALVACQEIGLIHRDIKPANIFVDRRGRFKLGDFGTARHESGGSTMTQKAGTELYMAPEVLSSGHYDHRVDIYSLGLVLYQLMNGNRLPFYPEPEKITNHTMEEAWVRRIRGDALPAPDQAGEPLRRVILKACAYKPEDRYASAQDMLVDLTAPEPRPQEPAVEQSAPATEKPLPAPAPEKKVEAKPQAAPVSTDDPFIRGMRLAEQAQEVLGRAVEENRAAPDYWECFKLFKEAEKLQGYSDTSMDLIRMGATKAALHVSELLAQMKASGKYDQQALFEAYKEQARFCDEQAQFELGMRYLTGKGTVKDTKKGEMYLLRAAEQGNPVIQRKVAEAYRTGGVLEDPDWDNSCKWYKEAAEQGDAESQYQMGVYQDTDFPMGHGSNPERAFYWYRKAAEQGHALAERTLALACLDGDGLAGIKKDEQLAFKWMNRSAKHGDLPAKYNLAVWYHLGKYVERDKKKALAMLREVSEAKAADEDGKEAIKRAKEYISAHTNIFGTLK